jgi:hypothetical protein
MDANTPSPVGPVFGPDFLVIVVNDDSKMEYHLEVYPDYNNPLLKAAKLPTQYYFVPQRVYLARKQDSPADYDFGMTVFKGLMTAEDTIGVSASTPGGEVDAGGGFCSFSTTFAIPDSVIKNAVKALKSGTFASSPPPRLAPFLTTASSDPDPLLGIVPILSNDVTIEVPQFADVAGGTSTAPAGGTPSGTGAPLLIKAQGSGKGSTEAAAISAFLVTCNQLAAGAIAGSLKNGVSPFTVHYNLSEQFYLPDCEVDIDIDMDKTYSSFSAAASFGGGLFSSASFAAAYANTVTSGAITTTMRMNTAEIPADLKTWIMTNVQQMQQQAMDLVKSEIFSWQPTDGGPAQASQGGAGGLLSSLFGGASISMKATYQKKSVHVKQTLKLDTTIAVSDTKSGDLNDLAKAIKGNVGKYLAIVDIGEYFKKIQVAATNAINWNEKLPDGTVLSDPLTAVFVSASYPDYDQPLDANGKPNLKTLAQGLHYQTGQTTSQFALAQWTANNPNDIVNISFLKLDNAPPAWPADQVTITKRLVFDANDPRVDLTTNPVVVDSTGRDHSPVVTGQEAGYVYAKFIVRPLPANVRLTLTLTLGPRTDTITVTNQNQKNVIWEIFSDKYFAQTQFTYSVAVEVDGPNFTDDPIQYALPQPITVSLPTGRVKYVNLVSLQLPEPPADKTAQINTYIRNYQAQPPASS